MKNSLTSKAAITSELIDIYKTLKSINGASDDAAVISRRIKSLILSSESERNKETSADLERFLRLYRLRAPKLMVEIDREFASINADLGFEKNILELKSGVIDVPNRSEFISSGFRVDAVRRLRIAKFKDFSSQEPKKDNLVEGGYRVKNIGINRKSTKPLISILTVCRNAEKNIETAIKSVLNQTYTNIEHIIVDGVSSDQTIEIIKSYEDKIAYYISEPDNGIYSAMNKALDLAEGEFIAVLNSDDYLKPNFLEKSLQKLESTGGDITYTNYSTENGFVESEEINEAILFTQLNIKHNTFLCSIDCFKDVGYFDPSRKVNSDARWIRCAYLLGKKFVKINEDLVFYSTQGLSSASSEDSKEIIIEESISLIRLCFPFLDESQIRKVYLSNFNSHSLDEVGQIYLSLKGYSREFDGSLRRFILFNFGNKESYTWKTADVKHCKRLIKICNLMQIEYTNIKSGLDNAPELNFLHMLSKLETISKEYQRVVFHFARDFSSPSETFIHEFISDLSIKEPNSLHIMLCDKRYMEDSRPYPYVLSLPWQETIDDIRRLLYDQMWDRLSPKLIVCHFALNGFWLFERLNNHQRQIPVINICHGIDVFSIDSNKDYSTYIKTYCSLSNNVRFATVSNYLRYVLAGSGVPENKIDLLPNCINESFIKNTKINNFYDGLRPLRILNVGRLIDWKGHRFLVESLSKVKFKGKFSFELTIVYGQMDKELDELTRLISSLGLTENIKLIPFINFEKEPGFYSSFDLFVLPSTVDKSSPPKTETFGVSLLEAIASGLVVIGTDAGGIPEVIGTPNNQAMCVKHGQADSIANAIQFCLDNPIDVFKRNDQYISERLKNFSKQNRYVLWQSIEKQIFTKRKVIYHFCSLGQGGASGSSLNIHKEFLARGWDSWFVTRSQEQSRLSRFIPSIKFISAEYSVDFQHMEAPRRKGFTMFSLDDFAISNKTILNLVENADVINLTWFAKFLSVKNVEALSAIGIPVVITLRDMYPITGGCHYFHGCRQWLDNCKPCPQYFGEIANYPSEVLRSKVELWDPSTISFLAISDHSEGILKSSVVARRFPVKIINNFVDERIFYPVDNISEIRQKLSLPNSKFIIGYLPSFNSFIKGHSEFISALKLLSDKIDTSDIAIAILSNDNLTDDLSEYETVVISQSPDTNFLRQFYNAVDLIVVPSQEETFSNTTTESLFCGTPVAGFKTGILASLESSNFVHTVEVGNVSGLAQIFERVIQKRINKIDCSRFASKLFSRREIGDAYENYFSTLIKKSKKNISEQPILEIFDDHIDGMMRLKSGSIIKRMYELRRSLQKK